MTQEKLPISYLRELFHADEAGWTVCRNKGGKISAHSISKRGQHNAGKTMGDGGYIIGTYTGVSRKEAVAAAMRREARAGRA